MFQPSLERLCLALIKGRLHEGHHVGALPPPPQIPATFIPATSRNKRIKIFPRDRPIDLAVGTIETCILDGAVTNAQRKALGSLRSWLKNNDVRSCGSARLMDFITLVSQAFFLKDINTSMVSLHVKDMSRLQVKDKAVSQRRLLTSRLSKLRYCGASFHVRDGQVIIIIDPADSSRLQNVKDHKTALLSTLLHECVHSYLQLFSFGRTSSHDISWFHLAAGLELAVNKHFDLGVSLQVFQSLGREYLLENAPRYSSGEWKRFFELYRWEGVDCLIRKLPRHEFYRVLGLLRNGNDDVIAVFRREYLNVYHSELYLDPHRKFPRSAASATTGRRNPKFHLKILIQRCWRRVKPVRSPRAKTYTRFERDDESMEDLLPKKGTGREI